ncbi:hypothetical protein [Bacillus thuringiensis]|nr:hypothetical protein [Bacillus thuringiensis]
MIKIAVSTQPTDDGSADFNMYLQLRKVLQRTWGMGGPTVILV